MLPHDTSDSAVGALPRYSRQQPAQRRLCWLSALVLAGLTNCHPSSAPTTPNGVQVGKDDDSDTPNRGLPVAPELPQLLLQLGHKPAALVHAILHSDGHWSDPSPNEMVDAQAKSKPRYAEISWLRVTDDSLIPAPNASGELNGQVPRPCPQTWVGLDTPSSAIGYALAPPPTAAQTQPEITSEPLPAKLHQALSASVSELTNVQQEAVLNLVFHVDLDHDGMKDWLVQTTHPALYADPEEYKDGYYSLIYVVNTRSTPPTLVAQGYVQSNSKFEEFELLELVTLVPQVTQKHTDIFVTAFYGFGSYMHVYRYDGQLRNSFATITSEAAELCHQE